MTQNKLLETVQSKYASVARSGLSNDSDAVRSVAAAFGYTADELADLPPESNMGLSCGNPVALAGLKPGEVVLDLGCGGGLDVLLAAKRVGPTGKAIGVDMTPEMIERARAGAARSRATNVEFHLAQIDMLPLPDASVDCVISNCVINLVPDKSQAFREILRVLKPGGRVAISDIALRQPLPSEVAASVQAYVGCIAGAILIADYDRLLREAGFASIVVAESGADLNVYAQASSGGCCSSAGGACGPAQTTAAETLPLHDELAGVLSQFDANAYAASVRVHAVKAGAAVQESNVSKETAMKTIQVYDKPMCCSTGICGPSVDPVLPRFAADLDWLKSQGHTVERYNLSQQPGEFVKNPQIHQLLSSEGTDCLPAIVVDGKIVSRKGYPTREMLAMWAGPSAAPSLPVAQPAGSCCGGSACC
ncbi:arsenite efflux transporter metallochaperone ArsD [Planctellipticum variicoloris]|uniref:arsenite efflux transporter metallochaperone ArsD n=1 Tax=Planctellipticum variicoloris TaxID=3064265 RepID=UPI003013CD30|nr:arsenite efflux transporter metallochaperone ArsD [Planctomycetaceae bacterium SH412]